MSAYPPPPPDYVPRKSRPSVVTRHAVYSIVACILLIVFGIVSIVFWPPAGYIMGIIMVVIGAIMIIGSFAFLMGQTWAFKYSGYANTQWAQTPEVREYFNLPPVQPSYPTIPPPTAPSSTTCPTCGSPLRYIQQYQRWYCDKEQKYV